MYENQMLNFRKKILNKVSNKLQTNDKPHIGILSGVANKKSLENNLLVRPIEQLGMQLS